MTGFARDVPIGGKTIIKKFISIKTATYIFRQLKKRR
jgi:hypothetical protein